MYTTSPSFLALWVGYTRNFHNAFSLKTIAWTWICLKCSRVLFLKTKKYHLKKDANHLKIAWYSKREKKNIEKRERKTITKNEKKSATIICFYVYFLYRKIYFFRKHIWKDLLYIVTFVLQFFHVVGYLKCSNKTTTPI